MQLSDFREPPVQRGEEPQERCHLLKAEVVLDGNYQVAVLLNRFRLQRLAHRLGDFHEGVKPALQVIGRLQQVEPCPRGLALNEHIEVASEYRQALLKFLDLNRQRNPRHSVFQVLGGFENRRGRIAPQRRRGFCHHLVNLVGDARPLA